MTGTGINTGGVTGDFGRLSVVTGAFPGRPATLASVPELDRNAQPTGRTIQGAVTVELTEAQLQLALQSSRFWIQGGTTTDPLNRATFPDQYGFGALRCSIDNLNGDNVEWLVLSVGCHPRLLLRLLRHATTDERHRRHDQAHHRLLHPAVQLRWQRVVQPRRRVLASR